MTTDIDAQKMENAQDEETLEMLKHITILKSIITSDNNNKGLTESSDGMLYLSRFAFGASFMTKKKSTIQMSQEEVDASECVLQLLAAVQTIEEEVLIMHS